MQKLRMQNLKVPAGSLTASLWVLRSQWPWLAPQDAALVKTPFAISNWQMYMACWDRELILVQRNLPLYIFR